MKKFNVAGPCDAVRHYMLPAAARLPEARALVDDLGYFVVHAPACSVKYLRSSMRRKTQAKRGAGDSR